MVSSSFDRRATCPAQPRQGWRTSIDLDWGRPIARADQSDMVRGFHHGVSAQFAVEYVSHTRCAFYLATRVARSQLHPVRRRFSARYTGESGPNHPERAWLRLGKTMIGANTPGGKQEDCTSARSAYRTSGTSKASWSIRFRETQLSSARMASARATCSPRSS